ncbi:MAG: hypothetical protein ABWZ78_07090 [Burkholderiaceae bacterium]
MRRVGEAWRAAGLYLAVLGASGCLPGAVQAQVPDQRPAPVLIPEAPVLTPEAPMPAISVEPPGVFPPPPRPPAAGDSNYVATGPRESHQFGVVLQGMQSDNVTLRPAPGEQSGQAVQIAPYVNGYLRTARSRADYAVKLKALHTRTSEDSDSAISPEVNGNGDLSLVGDSLRVAGVVNVLRVNGSPFDVAPQDLSTISGDADLYKSFAISPYSLGQIGSADYEFRYRAQVTDPGGSAVESRTNQVSGALMSRRVSSVPLGWFTDASVARTDFDDGTDFTRTSAKALARYDFSSTLRTGLGVAYTQINVVLDEDGDDSGFGPTAFVTWRPDPRTQMEASFTDAYYGNESSLRMSHRSSNWLFGLTWSKALLTGTEAGLLYFDPNVIFSPLGSDDASAQSVRQLVERRLLSGAGQVLDTGQTGASLVYGNSLIASLTYEQPRWAVAVSVYELRQSPIETTLTQQPFDDLRQRGASFVVNYRTSPIDTITLNGLYRTAESDGTGQEARLASATLGWRFAILRQTAVTPMLRVARQSSVGPTPSAEYTEHAILLALDHRF